MVLASPSFRKVDSFPKDEQIQAVTTNFFGNVCVTKSNSIYYWGWTFSPYSSYRLLAYYSEAPFLGNLTYLSRRLRRHRLTPNKIFSSKSGISKVSLGNAYMLILEKDGKVTGIGSNDSGQLGEGKTVISKGMTIETEKGVPITDIAAGMAHILLLDAKGKVYGQGANIKGQLGKAMRASTEQKSYRGYLKYSNSLLEPSVIPFREEVVQVHAGKYHTVLLTKDYGIYMLGSGRLRDINTLFLGRDAEDLWIPRRIHLPVKRKIVQVASGDNHILFLTENGEVYGLGSNDLGELDGGSKHFRAVEYIPRRINIPFKGRITKIKAKNSRSCLLTDTGEVWYWGGNAYYGDEESSRITGFCLLNEEPDIQEIKKEKIIDYDMGVGHDMILTEAI